MALKSSEGSQNGITPPPFLTKTYDMVDDPATDAIVSWSSSNKSFVVWNHSEFARDLLPKFFKHNNFSSFVRQLNTYGFRKVDPDRWEFANEGFVKGQRQFLKNIHRRKPSSSSGHSQQQQQQTRSSTLGCVEVGKFGLEGEIERLKRDKNVLMMELVRLRQQQQITENELQGLGQRLQAMEQRQQQMMTFLAKAMQNPGFLAQLIHQNENNNQLAACKKRRLPKQEAGTGPEESGAAEGQIVKFQPGVNDTARSIFLQLFNSELTSKVDMPSSSLETFLRELAHVPLEQLDAGSSLSYSSGSTVTKMRASTGLPDAHVSDLSGQYTIDVPGSPLSLPGLEHTDNSIVTHDIEVAECLGSRTGYTELKEVKKESMVLEMSPSSEGALEPEPTSTNVDGGTIVKGINDGFWEHFLTESPASTDTEAEVGTDMIENDIHEQEGSSFLTKNWWNSNPHVEQLAEQMGQLVSALKP